MVSTTAEYFHNSLANKKVYVVFVLFSVKHVDIIMDKMGFELSESPYVKPCQFKDTVMGTLM